MAFLLYFTIIIYITISLSTQSRLDLMLTIPTDDEWY